MNRKHGMRSGLLLMELLAAFLIFALAGTVCLRVLTRASNLSREAVSLRQGVAEATTAAEFLRSAHSPEEALERFAMAWPEGTEENGFTAELQNGTLVITPGDPYIIEWYAEGREVYSLQILPGWEALP